MCDYRINVKLPLIAVLLVLSAAAFAQDRPDALAAYREGRSLAAAGKPQEAAAKYREAEAICLAEIGAGTGTMDAYAVLTWALRRLERYGEVIARGEEALKVREDFRVIETMGEAYFYLGDYAASLRCMGRYLSALPNGEYNATAYFFIGETHRFQGRYRRADIAYTAAVSLSPDTALWWYRLGTVREEIGDRGFAADAYERALRINPNYAEAAAGLGRTRPDSARLAAQTDTRAADTRAADTSAADASAADAGVADTSVPDTSVPDTEVSDTSGPDADDTDG